MKIKNVMLLTVKIYVLIFLVVRYPQVMKKFLINCFFLLIIASCGGGGSDVVETALTDAATKQAEEEAAAALATAISDAEAAANSNRFESATLDSSKFQ